ncbi:tetratricopeptide repeat protein [bacterium]|nr:tetratricopeptide repeat protein [bacterium]
MQVLESAGAVHRFIFLSDIARSSRLAEAYPREYQRALLEHNALIEQAVAAHGGSVYKHTGDGYVALFESAGGCVECAAELAVALTEIAPLVADEPLLVRIALHAGELQPAGSEYFGPALNRASRVCQVCHPGQVLLSDSVAAVLDQAQHGLVLRDLGLHHLRDLAEPQHLYQLVGKHFALREFPPLATLENRPNNLVRQPNAFIGREQELRELAELLLGSTRLVTIIAPGGYGKSRLAAQLCANLLHRFANGVFMAYLAPVREAQDVPYALGNALGFQFTGGRTPEQQLCDYLRNKELLLCLDNFEHLLACAPLVAQLLAAAAKLKLIITSREPLRLKGEQAFVLEPLPLVAGAGDYSEAELLFADRAALVNRSFALTPENSAEVRHFCGHMAGIPLAIELAAAWMDSFTLAELHDELTSQLELEARGSDLEQRHLSLKACLDWSWNLLGTEQQEQLMSLSVFRGGFFADAAAAVLNVKGMALRAALAKLCDKSWLYSREVDGQTRFFLRDMLAHEYASAMLGGTQVLAGAGAPPASSKLTTGESARSTEDSAPGHAPSQSLYKFAVCAHAAYFSALAEREGTRLSGGGTPDGGAAQMQALRTWQLELENIYEALDTGLRRGSVDWVVPIVQWLRRFLEMTGAALSELEVYTKLLTEANRLGSPILELQAQLGLGVSQFLLGDSASSQIAASAAGELSIRLGDPGGKADSLNNLGLVNHQWGNYSAARELFEQSLAIRRELSDRWGEALELYWLGYVDRRLNNISAAREFYGQSLAIRRETGDRQGEGQAALKLGELEEREGKFAAARELYAQGLEIQCELGGRPGQAEAIHGLASLEYRQGNFNAALELWGQALAIRRDLGDREGETRTLNCLGNTSYEQGNFSAAQERYVKALAILRETNSRSDEAQVLNNLGNVKRRQGNYSEARELLEQSLAIHVELGHRMDASYSLNNLGEIERQQGNYTAARELFGRSLAIKRELGDRWAEAYTLHGLGLLEHEQGNYALARDYHAQALAIRRDLGDKSGMAESCAAASALFVTLGEMRNAAVGIQGALSHASRSGLKFDPAVQNALAAGQVLLDSAVESSMISSEVLSLWRAEGVAKGIEELAQFVQSALEHVTKAVSDNDKSAEA